MRPQNGTTCHTMWTARKTPNWLSAPSIGLNNIALHQQWPISTWLNIFARTLKTFFQSIWNVYGRIVWNFAKSTQSSFRIHHRIKGVTVLSYILIQNSLRVIFSKKKLPFIDLPLVGSGDHPRFRCAFLLPGVEEIFLHLPGFDQSLPLGATDAEGKMDTPTLAACTCVFDTCSLVVF